MGNGNNKIENEVNKIINSFRLDKINKYKSREKTIALIILYLRLKYNLDMGEELEYICDGPNDKGIDAIYISDETEEIYFIQSKYREDKNNTKDMEKDIKVFTGSLDALINQIKNKKYDEAFSKDLKNLIDSLELEEKIIYYQYNKIFITNVDTKSKFKNITNQLKTEMVDANVFLGLLNNISINKLNNRKINYIFKNINNILQLENEKALVFEVKTKKFVSEVDGVKDYSLFDLNVRRWLGKNKIYKEIKNRLKDLNEKGISQSDNILYHNGITMICENYEYNANKKEIIVENMKIVNGAQSIYAFYDNKDLLDNDHTILIKLIKTNDENLIKNISYLSNNQTQVRIRDLRSLHQKIIKLENLFKNSEKYIIKTKAGKDNLKNNSQLIVIEFDKLAQLVISFYLNKSYIAHSKSKILYEYFHEVFSHKFDRKYYEFLLDLHFEIEKILKNKRQTTSNEDDIILSSLYLTEFFILDTLSYLIKELFKKDIYNPQDFENIIKSFYENQNLWVKYIELIFGRIKYQLINEKGKFFSKDYRKIIKNKETNNELKNIIFEKFEESININELEELL